MRVALRPLPALVLALGLAVAAFPHRLARAEEPFEVVDLHVDLPWRLHYHQAPLDLTRGMMTRSAMATGHVAGIVLPFYIPDGVRPSGPEERDLQDILGTIEKLVWRPTSPFAPVFVGDTTGRKQVRAWLAMEGAQALAADPDAISTWVAKGVRIVGLAHAHDNDLAGSATGKKRGGLTDKGRQLAKGALVAGAMLDVSHLSDASIADVLALSKDAGRPVIATHSNARAVCPHPRNLTDAQLRAVAASGGVVGLNLHSPFLTSHGEASADDVLRMVDHLLRVAGEDHVAIGSDYDGGITPPKAFPDAASFPRLARMLLRQGHSEARVRKVFSGNALRVLDPP
jgi:membrane dipeptidase